MSNREQFRETFRKIEISGEKLNKIANAELGSPKKNYMKSVVAVAAMLVLVVSMGNVIYYAAQNNGGTNIIQDWIEHTFHLKKEHVIVNNGEISIGVVDSYVDENGLTYYELADGSRYGVRIEDPEHTAVFVYKITSEGGGKSSGIITFHGVLRKLDGKIYLKLEDEKIDITEDFADGVATGTFTWDSETYYDRIAETFEYRVEGTLEEYTVDVRWVEGE